MVYYVETNLIAILFGVILFIQGRRNSSRNETTQMILNVMLITLIISSICDIYAFALRGSSHIASLYFFNIVYFIMFVIGPYAWFIYTLVVFKGTSTVKSIINRTCIPAVILVIAIALNPLTNFFFTIDSDGIYHRATIGLAITWIVEWGYILSAFTVNLRAVIKEKSRQKREMYIGYLLFVIPMAVAAVCQMFFYGVTTTTIGYMFSIFLIFLNNQAYREQNDSLTGLKNKNAFLTYRDNLFELETAREISLFVIDADKFKFINDTYGHIKGDLALKDIASVLQETVDEVPKSGLHAFRFGGDEFVIVGVKLTPDEEQNIINAIQTKIKAKNESNKEKGEQYVLQLSIGLKNQVCKHKDEFDALIKKADEAMYEAKQSRR